MEEGRTAGKRSGTEARYQIAGRFGTLKGAQVYAGINGFISPVRKQNLRPFRDLLRVFKGICSFLSVCDNLTGMVTKNNF